MTMGLTLLTVLSQMKFRNLIKEEDMNSLITGGGPLIVKAVIVPGSTNLIQIEGCRFGLLDSSPYIAVRINGIKVAVESWADTKIIVRTSTTAVGGASVQVTTAQGLVNEVNVFVEGEAAGVVNPSLPTGELPGIPLNLAVVVAKMVKAGVPSGEIKRLVASNQPLLGAVRSNPPNQIILDGARFGSKATIFSPDYGRFIGSSGTRVVGWYTESRVAGYWPCYSSKDGKNCVLQQYFPCDGPDQYNCTLGLHKNEGFGEIFLSTIFKAEMQEPWSRNVKPIALRSGGAGQWGVPSARFDLYPSNTTDQLRTTNGHIILYTADGTAIRNRWASVPLWYNDNRWHVIEMVFSVSKNRYAVWIDGALYRECDGVAEVGSVTNIYWFAYHATDPGGPTKIWTERCYIASSPARVILGNAAKWIECTNKKIVDVINWTSTTITVPVCESGWFYVVNADGIANEWGVHYV